MTGRDGGARLGRGLAALLGDRDGDEAGDVRDVAVDALVPGAFQPRRRMDPEALQELTESIRRQGILQPLLARPAPGVAGQYQIVAGERRWRAAQLAGLRAVPVLVRALADSEAMAAALVENLQRADLNAIEEAEGYRRLMEEFALTQEQLGAAVGKSRSHVANMLRLLGLPDTVRQEVQNGALSAGHARALLAHPEPAKAALRVIAEGLNVRQTEALAASRPPRVPVPRDPETAALEQTLTEKLGLRVQISFDGKGGSLRVHYRTLDQLDGLIALLGGEH